MERGGGGRKIGKRREESKEEINSQCIHIRLSFQFS